LVYGRDTQLAERTDRIPVGAFDVPDDCRFHHDRSPERLALLRSPPPAALRWPPPLEREPVSPPLEREPFTRASMRGYTLRALSSYSFFRSASLSHDT